MTPTAISKFLFREKHSVTGMTKVLTGKGLIRREPDSKDRRSVNIIVNEEGYKAMQKMFPKAEEINRETLACFDDDELETLMRLLKQFRKHLLKKINEDL